MIMIKCDELIGVWWCEGRWARRTTRSDARGPKRDIVVRDMPIAPTATPPTFNGTHTHASANSRSHSIRTSASDEGREGHVQLDGKEATRRETRHRGVGERHIVGLELGGSATHCHTQHHDDHERHRHCTTCVRRHCHLNDDLLENERGAWLCARREEQCEQAPRDHRTNAIRSEAEATSTNPHFNASPPLSRFDISNR